MKILAEISVGELFDKITILNIKTQKIHDKEKLINIKNELNFLNNQVSSINVKDQDSLNQNISKLQFINEELWDIENHKRECEANKAVGIFSANGPAPTRTINKTKECTIPDIGV